MEGHTPDERESVKVLRQCIELQNRKARDYQNDKSTVRQADYYPRGLESIYDMLNTKMLRIRSLMDAGGEPNFESLEDTAKDLINYASFFVSYSRHGIDGQRPDRDVFNRPFDKVTEKQDYNLRPPNTPAYTGEFYGGTSVMDANALSDAWPLRDAMGNAFCYDKYGNVVYRDFEESMGA
jgi:hypothetical protein